MLKLKLQYFGHLMWRTDSFDLDAGQDWRQEGKRTTEDEMVGWHHWLNGHEFEQALGVGDGQGGLACCSPWGHKESDRTGRLNWIWTEQGRCCRWPGLTFQLYVPHQKSILLDQALFCQPSADVIVSYAHRMCKAIFNSTLVVTKSFFFPQK